MVLLILTTSKFENQSKLFQPRYF